MRKFFPIMNIFCLSFICLSCISLNLKKDTDENPTVQDLITEGQFDKAKQMFLTKTDINEQDGYGNTALHAASFAGDAELIQFLLSKNADSSIANDDGDIPLLVAIKQKNYSAVAVLSAQDSDIFIPGRDGKTSLDLLDEYKSTDLNNAIITKETGLQKDSQGQTIVHYFVKSQNQEAIRLCIQKQINLSSEDNNGITPLALALRKYNDEKSISIAADLIMAKCEPVRGSFSYFEDCVLTRNVSLRFDDNQTPLHLASVQGHSGIVKYLLRNGASTSVQDNTGTTPLHEAVRYGQTEIVKILLAGGAKINARDSLGKTPLLLIIPKKNQSPIYSVLLLRNADANAKDLYGDTPLHVATMNDAELTIIQKLVDSGADINERNKAGVTPLSLAVEHNLNDHIAYYAKLGADINAEDKYHETPLTKAFSQKIDTLKVLVNKENISSRDSYGNTPLHLAIKLNVGMEYIRYLLDCGADIDARNSDGDSVLYLAVENNFKEIGQILINKGANVYSTNTSNYSPLRLAMVKGGETQDWVLGSAVIGGDDGSGNTPLHYAAEWKLDKTINYIIQKGGNVNKKNTSGETPLFNAVKADSASSVKMLVSRGAITDTKDLLGNTPLHYSVRWNSLQAAEELIKSGCTIDLKNSSGKTPLSIASRSGAIGMVTLLLSKGAKINESDATGKTILTDAVQSEYPEMVQLLLTKGASVNIQDMYGRNSYHEACVIGIPEIITLLRKAGANPLSRDSFGKTPFSLVMDKEIQVVKAVLGDDINLTDSDGNNPLNVAITSHSSAEIILELINMGYPIDHRNGMGMTPLGTAIINNQHIAAKLLIKNKADPFIKDNNGNCAALLCFEKGNEDILSELLKYAANKTDLQGDTILHYAARVASTETIKYILDYGIDNSKRNIEGETPYDVAKRWNRPDIANLLL